MHVHITVDNNVGLPTVDMVAFPIEVVALVPGLKLEHETTRPSIAGVTTTERLEVRQLLLPVRGGVLVAVKGPHVPLEEVVRQDRPSPGVV